MVLNCEYLYDSHSLFLIEEDGSYQDSSQHGLGSIPEQISRILAEYRAGSSVIVKDLENWSTELQSLCCRLGKSVNAHLYLSGPKASSLDWHADDRDVMVVMISGEKTFLVENEKSEVLTYDLKTGDTLFIPYGVRHKALTSAVGSVHIGFGVWPEGMTIKDEYRQFAFKINEGPEL